jgi:alpha-tubulin suppressor-like RCC1 family protein
LFLSSTGEIYACGQNDFGQLGFETQKNQIDTPQKVDLPSSKFVCAGLVHSHVLTKGSQVFSFGDN